MKKILLSLIISAFSLVGKAQTIYYPKTGQHVPVANQPVPEIHHNTDKENGDDCFDRQDYQCALGYYLTILKTDSLNFKLLRRAGFCFMNTNNASDEMYAIDYYNRTLKIQPNDTVTNYNMGVLYMDRMKASHPSSEDRVDYRAKAVTYLKKAIADSCQSAKIALSELNGLNSKSLTAWNAGDEKIYGSKDEKDFEEMVSHASDNKYLCRYIGFTQFYTNKLSEYLETNRAFSVDNAVFKQGFEVVNMTRSGVYAWGVKPPKVYITYGIGNGRITSVKVKGPLIELVNLFLWYWPYDAIWSDQVKLKPGVVATKHSFGDLVSFKWIGSEPYITITKDLDMIVPIHQVN